MYSFRKGPVRDYLKLLSWEDRIRSHPYFVRAAINAIRIYIQLNDDPSLATAPQCSKVFEGAEKKKAAKKAKKAAVKKPEGPNSAVDAKDANKDDDPKGEALAKTDRPLEEALKFLKPLQELSPSLLETQLLAFDVHFRRRRFS